jgi:hypothetical protein
MKIKSPTLAALGGLLGASVARAWMRTLDYKASLSDAGLDPASPQCRGCKLFLFWHEYLLFPFFLHSLSHVTALLSRHGDADILSRLLYQFRLKAVRGSTRRGGVAALLQLLRQKEIMHLAITPDGPRGPRRRMAPGPVYLASKLGLPVVAVGFGADRPWRIARAWDRFAIPRPFARVRAVVGPEVFVPDGVDRHGLEQYRQRIEALLNRLCDEADAWAASGARWKGQVSVTFRSRRRSSRGVDAAHPDGRLHPQTENVASMR